MAELDNKTFSLPRTAIRSLSLMRITCSYVTVTTCLFSFSFFFLGTRSDEIITTAFLFYEETFPFLFSFEENVLFLPPTPILTTQRSSQIYQEIGPD